MVSRKITKKIDGRNVNAYCDEAFSIQAKSILELVGNAQKSKNVLLEGYKIQIGWSMFIMALIDGELALTAPDYVKNPFEDTVSDISLALWIHMRQIELLKKTNLEGEYATFKDTMIILKEALDADDLFFLRQEARGDGDSGWYLGLLGDKKEGRPASDYISVRTYQLLTIRPELLKLLFLPTGCMAIIKEGEITEILDAGDNRVL